MPSVKHPTGAQVGSKMMLVDGQPEMSLESFPYAPSPGLFESQNRIDLNSGKLDQIYRKQNNVEEKYRLDVSQRSIENEEHVA
ncbi:hypothetical protein [Bradyrhizobium sp. Ash2021]|uniref:hypothetical protein n=1 Tax=Bradyrhizobium sp. Ash2021 TaxID=2954771 RepID=UPI002816240E|nr:hypothetical protein [Bradyrhizobium sp. Ash2021]WMT73428.1 hypothetical protein NL528_36610 [Bradyrhizobium sp. Ash2021]